MITPAVLDDTDATPAPHIEVDADPAVMVDGLTRVYAGPPDTVALHPCSFTIDRGDYVSITGPSGSGKTTLLSLLGLLDTPTAGTYELDGIDVAELTDPERAAIRAHRIGFVFQAFHLVGYRSVIDNIELGLTYQGIPHRQRRHHALDIAEHVGLAHRTNALCSTLSGGEKQRVAIARTLIRQPSLVLCDEPTGNLDTATSDTVLELIEQLHQDGLTIVIITHDPDIATRAQRHLTIRDGHVDEPQPSSDDSSKSISSQPTADRAGSDGLAEEPSLGPTAHVTRSRHPDTHEM